MRIVSEEKDITHYITSEVSEFISLYNLIFIERKMF